jgi:hypothetical protein
MTSNAHSPAFGRNQRNPPATATVPELRAGLPGNAGRQNRRSLNQADLAWRDDRRAVTVGNEAPVWQDR